MNHKGVVLMEAILSVIIISISLTLIMQSFLSSYHAVTLQKDYTQAILLIENHLSKVFFDPKTTDDKDSSNDTSKFEYQISQTKSEMGIDKAILNVQWPSRQKKRELSIATFIYEEKNEKDK